MGKSFTPNAPRVGTASAVPTPVGKPSLVRGSSAAPKKKFDDAPAPRPQSDALSSAIGDFVFRQDAMFDWCANPAGIRHRFRRHYPNSRILIDVFGSITDSVLREVNEKVSALKTYNATNNGKEIGYLPLLTGSLPTKDEIEYAQLGGFVPLKAR